MVLSQTKTVSRSSTKSEYKALTDTATEIMWFQSLLTKLGFTESQPLTLWCDNIGATYLFVNIVFHACTKHVEIDYHFVKEKLAARALQIQFIYTHYHLDDIMTKGFPNAQF